METKPKRIQGFGGLRGGMPWWAILLMLGVFYLLGWVLRLTGVIPAH
ncbi:hypothetical protein [Hymenobacter gummosus]|nr:hypothetical protein [Hymenobacter gummosus]